MPYPSSMFDMQWRDLGILFAIGVFMRLVLALVFKYKRHMTR